LNKKIKIIVTIMCVPKPFFFPFSRRYKQVQHFSVVVDSDARTHVLLRIIAHKLISLFTFDFV